MGFGAIEWGKLVDAKRIGSGGMAELFLVDRVSPLGIRRPLVIKRIHQRLLQDPESRSLFVQEARIHSGLDHPHIVHFYDLGMDKNYLYLALEYVEGGDLLALGSLIKKRGMIERAALTLQMLQEMADALGHLYHKQIVHQDVSGNNILYSSAGAFKLCDFGLATADSDAIKTLRRTGRGKFRYMSPEQATGTGIDHRSDIFSLGLCAIELFSGRSLFAELSKEGLARSLRRGAYLKSIAELELPFGLKEIIDRCIQPSPRDRFCNPQELFKSVVGARSMLCMGSGTYSIGTELLSLSSSESSSEATLEMSHSDMKPEVASTRPNGLSRFLSYLLALPVLFFLPWITKKAQPAVPGSEPRGAPGHF